MHVIVDYIGDIINNSLNESEKYKLFHLMLYSGSMFKKIKSKYGCK